MYFLVTIKFILFFITAALNVHTEGSTCLTPTPTHTHTVAVDFPLNSFCINMYFAMIFDWRFQNKGQHRVYTTQLQCNRSSIKCIQDQDRNLLPQYQLLHVCDIYIKNCKPLKIWNCNEAIYRFGSGIILLIQQNVQLDYVHKIYLLLTHVCYAIKNLKIQHGTNTCMYNSHAKANQCGCKVV